MPMRSDWNHNTQYHGLILSAIPECCEHALDVGCGTGAFALQLASHCGHVTGIDLEPEVISTAMKEEPRRSNVCFATGDIMTYPLPPHSFTFLSSIATLHHLPLEPALKRFRELLAPKGTLTIIGLYRAEGLEDALYRAAGFAASWAMRRLRHFHEVAAPMQAPNQTLGEIRKAVEHILPGSLLKRRLFFRYSLIWHKPDGAATETHLAVPGTKLPWLPSPVRPMTPSLLFVVSRKPAFTRRADSPAGQPFSPANSTCYIAID